MGTRPISAWRVEQTTDQVVCLHIEKELKSGFKREKSEALGALKDLKLETALVEDWSSSFRGGVHYINKDQNSIRLKVIAVDCHFSTHQGLQRIRQSDGSKASKSAGNTQNLQKVAL